MSQGPLAPIHDERLVELTGAHVSTVRRWKRRAARIPLWLQRLVRICVQGELADIDRAWRGWRIVRGHLVSPEGSSYTPGAVRAGHLWKCRALELGARERQARIAHDADAANNERLERLAAVHRALEHARQSFEDVTRDLSSMERNRVYCSSPGVAPAPAARPGRILGRIGPKHGVSAGLLLEVVDPRVSSRDGAQHLIELAPHPHGESAACESCADEREQDALGQAHGGG